MKRSGPPASTRARALNALRTARASLRADCTHCAALCCIAPPFSASSDFAINKRAGEPCPNLHAARCAIHDDLRDRGFRGCTVYDCFGAGQAVTQALASHAPRERLYQQLPLQKQLHEMQWYLHEALTRVEDPALVAALSRARERCEALARTFAVQDVELTELRHEVGSMLGEVSERVRARVAGKRPDRRHADLIGKKLRGADLRGASLRGALLIGTDLRTANLTSCDLLGADLRDTDLRGADLADVLFVTAPQLEAAQGDATTRLPAWLDHPQHWSTRTKRSLPRV
jgi:hypothetical protein